MNVANWIRHSLILSTLLLMQAPAVADDPVVEDDVVITYAMFSDPVLNFPPSITRLPQEYVTLWVKSLHSPDAELQRRLAIAIEREHRLQHADFSVALPALRELLQNSQLDVRLRSAAAAALLTLDDQDSAQAILQLAQHAGPTLAQLAEPVFARWGYKPAISVWLSRLSDARVRRNELRLAIECLESVHESNAVPGLRSITLDPDQESTLRLAAARSWGSIQRSGLEDTAVPLLEDRSSQKVLERLIGASLLRHHSGTETQEILVTVATDAEPAVAAIAWERLLAIDSSLTLPVAESSLKSPDARIRGYAARAFDEHPSVARLIILADLLSDPHPDVRNNVRRMLLRHAGNPEFDKTIRTEAVRILQAGDWRGIEQAGMLLAVLDHEEIAPTLLALLEHPRGEVAMMSAWGLRVLAVPETLPSMLAYTQQISDASFQRRREFFQQCGHLFEAFGLMNYQPAEPWLRSFVSRKFPPLKEEFSRCTAIWSLGLLHEGQPDERLARQLVGRLNDINGEDPESDAVRRFSAITLGRMKADSALSDLRSHSLSDIPPRHGVDYACRWAIKQLTGEPFLEPVPDILGSVDWFLVPLNKHGTN